MDKITIKKELYKQNPDANFVQVKKGACLYKATILLEQEQDLSFLVPVDDMGDAIFYNTMPAKGLIRWLVIE